MQLSQNALKVLRKRYLTKNEKGEAVETPEEMFRRVAGTAASAEAGYDTGTDVKELEEGFYGMLTSLEFLPNSPTLMNAGKELGQLSACFVLPVEDSMEGIFDAIKQAAMIHKSGGGTGFSFSRLRPSGATVNSTGGVASGPVSFMKVFNAATEAVKQGGVRRGANMGILRVDHPDILGFIKCKRENKDITNFNISVAITEEFMRAVETGGEYPLISPQDKRVVEHINAKEVFELIVDMAWKNGEPGIIFIDRMNRDNVLKKTGQIESTNPCLHGDTYVATREGLVRIRDLYEKYKDGAVEIATDDRVINESVIINGREYFENGVTLRKAKVIKTGTRRTLNTLLDTGQIIKTTPEHKFLTNKGWTKAQGLKPGNEVLVQSGKGFWPDSDDIGQELGFLLGWLTGDGWLTADQKVVGMVFSAREEYIMNRIQTITQKMGAGKGIVNKRENGIWQVLFKRTAFVDRLKALGVKPGKAHTKRVPQSIFAASEETVAAYLNGLFSSDGTVNYIDENHRDVRLSSTSLELLQDVQLILLNLGVFSKIYERTKQGQQHFTYTRASGEEVRYQSKPYYEIIINGNDIWVFKEAIGSLTHIEKNSKLCDVARKSRKNTKFIAKVKRVWDGEEADVYDISEPVSRSLIGNGAVVHNCGEQPLLPYESCNLGSVNLAKMLKQDGDKWIIDYEKLGKTVDLAVRFLDNIIDVNRYPLEHIEKATKGSRKIGLGVMGFADMLIMLGIPYDSEEAIEVADSVMGFINKRSKEKSAGLAAVKGKFPFYDDSTYAEQGIVIRNATTTTIAPTGTISIIAGTSSGIEPLFAVSFVRNVMDKDRLPEVHPIFEEVARKRGFYSENLMEEIALKGTLKYIQGIPEDVKRLFVTAHDIDPKWHVKMQAVFQRHTDNAVSKTVNFPHHATREDVRNVYLLAYRLGCKGVTIYRDRSREEQVLNIGVLEGGMQDGFEKPVIGPRTRPEITRGITEKVRIGCGNLYITVNYDDSGICEVFTNLGRGGGCPSQSEATSRLISIALRSGVDVNSIVEQLKGIRCLSTIRQRANGSGIKVLSCPDAIGKALERVVKMEGRIDISVKGDQPDCSPDAGTGGKAICPECGGMLERESGCVVCRDCGYSKCG